MRENPAAPLLHSDWAGEKWRIDVSQQKIKFTSFISGYGKKKVRGRIPVIKNREGSPLSTRPQSGDIGKMGRAAIHNGQFEEIVVGREPLGGRGRRDTFSNSK